MTGGEPRTERSPIPFLIAWFLVPLLILLAAEGLGGFDRISHWFDVHLFGGGDVGRVETVAPAPTASRGRPNPPPGGPYTCACNTASQWSAPEPSGGTSAGCSPAPARA